MKDFNQFYISSALAHFKQGFQEKWDLIDYHDQNAPAIFFGLYWQEDIQAFLNHKGPRLVVWGGNDMHAYQLDLIKKAVLDKTTFTFSPPGEFSNTLTNFNIPHKILYIPNKDYSTFTPTPLGENVYVYLGQPGNLRLEYFEFDQVIKPLIYTFGEDRIKWVTENKLLPIEELKTKYYNDCFVSVKPNKRGGATSMYELAHMGRKTIGKGQEENLLFYTEYKDIKHLIELIVEESEYIGKTKHDISNGIKDIFVGNEWLYLNYWR